MRLKHKNKNHLINHILETIDRVLKHTFSYLKSKFRNLTENMKIGSLFGIISCYNSQHSNTCSAKTLISPVIFERYSGKVNRKSESIGGELLSSVEFSTRAL